MPDSITREELMREVADRLDADPGLVARRSQRRRRRRGVAGRGRSSRRARARRSRGRRPRPLSARERRELALLAMCVKLPAEGRELLERLTDEHFSSPVAARACAWLREHLDEPSAGSAARRRAELLAYVTQVGMESEREPASREAMELNFLELERGMVEDAIATAEANGGEPPVELQRRRAELAERIARTTS